jgi:hypothetical protein
VPSGTQFNEVLASAVWDASGTTCIWRAAGALCMTQFSGQLGSCPVSAGMSHH